MVTKTFRLPEELVKKLLLIAGENELSLNKLVIQCLEYAIENIDQNDMHGNMV
ncbi:MAG: type II toxin-antitoxin system HicB family antitoxin [Oscillospiraceae bacterium]|nr:type II toxin-antitoxin system HicB family antitoxin [Oscillospiraceae bacterium]